MCQCCCPSMLANRVGILVASLLRDVCLVQASERPGCCTAPRKHYLHCIEGDMAQQATALISRLLGNIARYSVATGIGVAALQSSLYTGTVIVALTTLVAQLEGTAQVTAALVRSLCPCPEVWGEEHTRDRQRQRWLHLGHIFQDECLGCSSKNSC